MSGITANFEAPVRWRSREERLDELLAREDIRGVIARAVRAGDRLDGPLMASCFRAGAPVSYAPMFVGTIEQLVEVFGVAHTMSAASLYHIGTQIIDVDGDTATAETYVMAYRRFNECNEAGANYYRLSGFRYLDKLEQRDDEWRIVKRAYIPEWSTVRTTDVERPAIGLYDKDPSEWPAQPLQSKRDRTDLSYTF